LFCRMLQSSGKHPIILMRDIPREVLVRSDELWSLLLRLGLNPRSLLVA
jgi:hypothetical protein